MAVQNGDLVYEVSATLGHAATLLSVIAKVRSGDFGARMPLVWTGVAGEVAHGLNDVIAANQTLAAELARVNAERADQLAVSSKYRSELLAHLSHELRAPLNSMLILASTLEGNRERNLTEEQVKYASVIHSSGTDLLRLLDDILETAR